jgi:putative MATE family efflux protein
VSQERQHHLASENVNQLLWKLALPAGVGMFVMALYNVVDTIFIGRAVGPLGIAALSIVFPVQMFVISLGGMVGIGGASIISRALGARNLARAENTLGNVISSALGLSIVVTAVILANSGFWMGVLGTTDTIAPYVNDYLTIIIWGAIFQVYAMSVNNTVRAEGNARVAMLTMVIGAVTNIGLDALFIMKLGLGVRGAAIATIIGQACSCIYLTRYYLAGNSTLKIHLKNLKLKLDIMREVIALGMASFVRMVATSLIFVFLNRTVATLGGDIYLAAVGIVVRVSSFAIMPLIAVAQGLQPVLGFSYGAKRYDRSIAVTDTSIKVATLISIVAFVVIFFFSRQLVSIFSDDAALVEIGSSVMKTIFLAWYLVGFQAVGSTVFQAIGKAVPAFLTAISRQIMFLLPLLIILPRFLEMRGIWLAFPIADGIAFAFTLALFIPQMRRFREQRALMEVSHAYDTSET